VWHLTYRPRFHSDCHRHSRLLENSCLADHSFFKTSGRSHKTTKYTTCLPRFRPGPNCADHCVACSFILSAKDGGMVGRAYCGLPMEAMSGHPTVDIVNNSTSNRGDFLPQGLSHIDKGWTCVDFWPPSIHQNTQRPQVDVEARFLPSFYTCSLYPDGILRYIPLVPIHRYRRCSTWTSESTNKLEHRTPKISSLISVV